jgi:hypothetical protein
VGTTKTNEPQCIEPGCKNPQVPGAFMRCEDHRPKPQTTKHLIAIGYTFKPEPGTHVCVACYVDSSVLDRKTGLCRGCWRHWRWSPAKEMSLISPGFGDLE